MTANKKPKSAYVPASKRRDGLFKISDVAAKLKVTPRTIRFYEDEGLLPGARRTQGKMRLFDKEDLDRILEIRKLQSERGMTLEQIKAYIKDERGFDTHGRVKKRFRIVTDVTATLPEAFFEQHDVIRLPIMIKLNKRIYGTPGHLISNAQLFEMAYRSGNYPTTEPADDKVLAHVFQDLLRSGAEQVLVITLSSMLSETFRQVNRQAHKFRDLHIAVLDSRTSAAGLAILVTEAVRLKEQGQNLVQVKQGLEQLIPQLIQIFTVQSLEHLYKGGRIGPELSGYMSILLDFKPVLALRGAKGFIELIGRAETTPQAYEKMSQALLQYLQAKGDPRYLALVYNGLASDAERLHAQLCAQYPGAQVICAEANPVLGVHLGPSALGVAVLS